MHTLSKRLANRVQFSRFAAVGLLNAAVGYGAILIALYLGLRDIPANMAGYAVGLVVSYFLNSRWTFGGRHGTSSWTPVRYVLVFFLAYGANLAVVLGGEALGYDRNPLTHFAGICAFAAVFYVGAAAFVFSDGTAGHRQASGWRAFVGSRWPELLLISILVFTWLVLKGMSVSHDVVWQMWVARQLLGGARLYKDILEVDPPLWFWLAVPAEMAAEALKVGAKEVIVTATFAYLGIALLLTGMLLDYVSNARRASLLGCAVLATVFIPFAAFAQREHLALIGAVPYLALAARRADARATHWMLAVAVGIVTALGFALKHYFVAVPFLLEVWLVWRLRSKWRPFRPESLTLLILAVAYVVIIVTATPQYLTAIVPTLELAYGGFKNPVWSVAWQPIVLAWVLATLLVSLLHKRASSITVAAAITAIGFVAAYFIQQKGWWYQTIPATGAFFIALGSLLIVPGEGPSHSARGVAVLVAMAFPLAIAWSVGSYRNPNVAAVDRLLSGVAQKEPVLMLTAHPSNIWPMVEDLGYVWPSRYYAFWMLDAIADQLRERGHLSPQMKTLADNVRRQTVFDIECTPPEIILVDAPKHPKSGEFDVLRFFRERPEFAAIFGNYHPFRVSGRYMAYKINDSDGKQFRRPPNCRTIH